jgi:hypothetical protein
MQGIGKNMFTIKASGKRIRVNRGGKPARGSSKGVPPGDKTFRGHSAPGLAAILRSKIAARPRIPGRVTLHAQHASPEFLWPAFFAARFFAKQKNTHSKF